MQNKTTSESIVGQLGVNKTSYKTLQDIVYENLRDDILSGKLAPDTALNTNEISRNTNISRTPIREAINKLVSVGLVQKVNHHEAKVASFLSDEIHEIYYMRAALEGIAARMAARNMSQSSKEKLMMLAEDCFKCIDDESDDHFFEINQEFHFLIYQNVKTPLIREIIDQFYTITKRYRKISYDLENRKKQVADEHMMIAKYILEGNEIMAEHYGNIHHTNTISNIDKFYSIN